MKVLITGVAGLLGSRLADWIIENIKNVEVIGIDDLSGGYLENINSNVKFYQVDCKSNEIKKIFIMLLGMTSVWKSLFIEF